MKTPISFLIILLMTPTALFAFQAERKSDSTGDGAVNNSTAQATHRQQMELYRSVAEKLIQASGQDSIDRVNQTVEMAAAKLPFHSRYRMLLNDTRRSLSQIKTEAVEADADTEARVGRIRDQLKKMAEQMRFQPQPGAGSVAGFPPPTPLGEIEIKRYPGYRSAVTPLEQPSSQSDSPSFERLYRHLQKNQIAMTSPVEISYRYSSGSLEQSAMAFLFPAGENGEIEKVDAVEIVDNRPCRVLSIGIRGPLDAGAVERAVEQLAEHSVKLTALFETDKSPRVFAYHSPSVPKEEQFFEVQLELQDTNMKIKHP